MEIDPIDHARAKASKVSRRGYEGGSRQTKETG